MSGYIYIVSDGAISKIGITNDIDKRMSSYKTHNAKAKPFKNYPCEMAEAKRVEKAVMAVFGDRLTGEGREWFAVGPEVMDAVVLQLLGISTVDAVMPALHGVRVTEAAYSMLAEMGSAFGDGNPDIRKKAHDMKDKVAEIFAKSYDLGIPEDRLPASIVRKDTLTPDWTQLKPPYSQKLLDMVCHNGYAMPNDDHVWRFFRLARFSSGHFMAFCTAKVSMPYQERTAPPDEVRKMVDTAAALGWYCTFHDEWSWHYPGKTGLVLYQAKTPIETRMHQFTSSFRKWVIERQEMLKLEAFDQPELLEKAVEDIANDATFPLGVQSYEELVRIYLEPFWMITADGFFAKSAYEFLFDKWHARHSNR